MGTDGLLIGQVAARSGVSRKALRLYEAAEILPPPRRSAAGYRVYGGEAVALLAFVSQARRLGFRLDEIREIVTIKRSGEIPCRHVRELIRRKTEVPPLRARRSDIPELAEHFLRRHGTERANAPSGFSEQAVRALLLHDYPGNVRELENLIQRAVILAQGHLVTIDDLPALAGNTAERGGEARLTDLLTMPLEQALRELERTLIKRALIQAGGNKTEPARLLQMRRQQLYARLKY